MSDVFQAVSAFRASLLRRERQSAIALTRAYSAVYSNITKRIDELIRKIEQADNPPPSWLYEEQRLKRLQVQIRGELAKFSAFAEREIAGAEIAALRAAQAQAAQVMIGSLPAAVSVAFDRLPIKALTDLAGTLQDGSPLRDLLNTFGPDASRQAGNILFDGLARGKNPRVMARELKNAAGIPLQRALAISRTEVLRDYREASRETWKANRDVVRGWIWSADLSARCCVVCISMHGTRHDLDEPMQSHPMCRCAMIPETVTWKELGFSIDQPDMSIQSGLDWFENQSPSLQREILGDASYRAFESGAANLSDFVGRSYHPRWGAGRYRKSLKEMLGPGQALEFYRKAA